MNNHAGYAVVIDQEQANRTFCQTVLEQIGYHVYTAARSDHVRALLDTQPALDLLVVAAPLINQESVVLLELVRQHAMPAAIILSHDHGPHTYGTAVLPDAVMLIQPFTRAEFCAAVTAAWRSRHASNAKRHTYEIAQAEKIAGMNRLSASIAHEINNPLQALQSSLRLLSERPLPEEKRAQILLMANNQVDTLVGIVQQMMDLHRPALRDSLRPVSIHDVLESALLPLVPRLHERGIEVERDWDGMLPRVRGVGNQLKQVFGSLVLNAIDAMPRGGRLMLQTKRIEHGGSPRVQIAFADTGNGIAAEDLPHIFEPFYSTHTARTGLGLAVSYSIVEQHQGTLSAESDDHGATLRVVLPALQ